MKTFTVELLVQTTLLLGKTCQKKETTESEIEILLRSCFSMDFYTTSLCALTPESTLGSQII